MFSIRPAAYYKTERGTYQLILQVTHSHLTDDHHTQHKPNDAYDCIARSITSNEANEATAE